MSVTLFIIKRILFLSIFISISGCQAARLDVTRNGPRIEIKPALSPVVIESQVSNKILTCRALGDRPGMFNELKWAGPNSMTNWLELSKRHSVKETTFNGHSLVLDFQRPTPDDSGEYYCLGTYQSSDVYNASVKVIVYNPIKLENCPQQQYIIEGATGQIISCHITGDSLSVVISKGDVAINQSDRYRWSDQNGLEIIGPVTKQDEGQYNIEVTTDITGDRRLQPIMVKVRSKPRIIPTADYIGVEGERVELKCETSGDPPPSVYWYDPKRRNLTTVGGYRPNEAGGTLIIEKLNRLDDNGNFECIADNGIGKDSRFVRMEVYQRPQIVAFENKTVDEGAEVTMECRGTGNPKPTFAIRKNGQQPYSIGDGNLTDSNDAQEGGGAEMYVHRVKVVVNRSHFGLHYCNASNQAGSAERVGHLFVRHRPDLSQTPPEQFVKLGKNITVTCHIRAYPTPQVSWYIDNQQIVNIENSNFKTSPDGQTHIITMMPPTMMQSYARYRCVAINSMGQAEQTIISRYTTAPSMVNAVVLESAPTTVKLQLSVSSDGGDRVRAYKYRADGVTKDPYNPIIKYPVDKQNETYIDASPLTSMYTIRNLYPYYRYRITLRAINDVGEGDVTEINVETSQPTRPEPPVIVKPGAAYSSQSGIASDYQNGYLLRWSPPDTDNGDPITKYIIKFFKVDPEFTDKPLDNGEERVIEQMNERPMYARISQLESNQRYRLQLRASNKYGTSEPASVVIYTLGDRPPMPDDSQTLPWLTEPSTPLLVVFLIVAILALLFIDIMFCYCFQIGVSHFIRNCCCPAKANSVISDKTYT